MTILAVVTMAVAATSASAQTFYVNWRGGSKTCAGKGLLACGTITEAIAVARTHTGPNTIEVESNEGYEGLYNETLVLNSPKDAGLTINGEEPGVVIDGKAAPAVEANLKGSLTLSNLRLETTTPGLTLKSAVYILEAAVTLNNIEVINEQNGGLDGIDVKQSGSLTMNGSRVEMEEPAGGDAIYAYQARVALNGVTILNGGQSEDPAGGVASEKGSLSLTNTHISVKSEPPLFPVVTAADTSVELAGVTVRQNGTAPGVQVEESPVSANGLSVEMVDPAATAPAVDVANEGGASTFSHLDTTYGTWNGTALWATRRRCDGQRQPPDHRPLSSSPSLKYDGPDAPKGLLVQRSLLQAGANAKPGALQDERASATLDSSEVLGGRNAIYFEALEKNSALALTISASTLDAGAAGIAADTAGTTGVEAVSSAISGSSANVAIQGSVVLEKQIASFSPGDTASIGCAYSAVPSQAQTAGRGRRRDLLHERRRRKHRSQPALLPVPGTPVGVSAQPILERRGQRARLRARAPAGSPRPAPTWRGTPAPSTATATAPQSRTRAPSSCRGTRPPAR